MINEDYLLVAQGGSAIFVLPDFCRENIHIKNFHTLSQINFYVYFCRRKKLYNLDTLTPYRK